MTGTKNGLFIGAVKLLPLYRGVKMKTINIKGKNYVMVNERIKAFRENFKGYSLLSEVVEMTDISCTIKATILNDKREPVATGFAREVVGKTPINKFAFVENAETSAWGRALGNFGIGIDDAICTAEELVYKTEHDKEAQVVENINEYLKAELAKVENKKDLLEKCKDLKVRFPKSKDVLIKLYNQRIEELQEVEEARAK